jgi:hypothetical protein
MKSTNVIKKSPKSVVKCNSFKEENFKIEKVESDNKRVQAQYIGYPRYYYTPSIQSTPQIMTDPIIFNRYGIPRLSEDGTGYYKTDENRQFIKIPIDETQQSCIDLANFAKKVDRYVESNVKNYMPKEFFTKQIAYSSIIKTPTDEIIAKIKEKQKDKYIEPPNFVKLKLNINYDTKAIDTIVWKHEKEVQEDGTIKDIQIKVEGIKTVSDLCEHFKYGCTAKFIFMINKFWAQKQATGVGPAASRAYGVGLKVIVIDILDVPESGKIIEQYKDYIDDVDDENENFIKPKKEIKKEETDEESEKIPPKKEVIKQKSEEESDETESESEEEEEKPKLKPKKGK